MRITIFDPSEFDHPDSEECLGIAIASRHEYSSIDAFRRAIMAYVEGFSFGTALPKPRENDRQERVIEKVVTAVTNFAISPGDIMRCVEFTGDWSESETEVVLESTDWWVWCSWYSTA